MLAQQEEDVLDALFEEEARASAPPPLPAPPPEPIRDPEYERTLAEIRAAIAPKPKPVDPKQNAAQVNAARAAFDKRLAALKRSLPFSRFRRLARIVSFGALAMVLLVGVFGRVELVRAYPALAGLYSGIGLGVNVVGLEFSNAKTLTSLRNGRNVMQVTAKIRSISAGTVPVPPVLVTLFDDKGGVVLEWTVIPQAREMEPGEVLELSTDVNAPPASAAKVRLSFSNVRGDAGGKGK
jgi:hypothetical protein